MAPNPVPFGGRGISNQGDQMHELPFPSPKQWLERINLCTSPEETLELRPSLRKKLHTKYFGADMKLVHLFTFRPNICIHLRLNHPTAFSQLSPNE